MQTAKFTRKPFEVDAVQVTVDNFDDVAKWCKGKIVTDSPGGEDKHIKVKVERVMNDKQTQAYVGDWVLYAGTGFKVYTNKAFRNSFEPLDGVDKDKAVQASKPQNLEELRTTAAPA